MLDAGCGGKSARRLSQGHDTGKTAYMASTTGVPAGPPTPPWLLAGFPAVTEGCPAAVATRTSLWQGSPHLLQGTLPTQPEPCYAGNTYRPTTDMPCGTGGMPCQHSGGPCGSSGMPLRGCRKLSKHCGMRFYRLSVSAFVAKWVNCGVTIA